MISSKFENNSELNSTVVGEKIPFSMNADFVLNNNSSKVEKLVFKTLFISSKKFSFSSSAYFMTLGGILSLVKNSLIQASLPSISSLKHFKNVSKKGMT